MTDQAAPSSDIWAPYLKEGEEVLWQGRPSGAFHMRRGDGWTIVGGLFAMLVTGFMASVVFSSTGFTSNLPLAFKIFFGIMLLFGFVVGLYMVTLRFYFDAVKRGKTCYAITNQRALSLTKARKKTFKEEPLNAATNLDYVPGALASIYYKKVAKRVAHRNESTSGHAGARKRRTTYSTTYIYEGFELISDGAVAYQTMLGVIGAKLANPDGAKSGEAWQDFLLEGEALLWEGAPATGPRPTKFGIVFSVLGLIVMAIAGPTAMRAFTSEYGGAEVMVFGTVAAVVFLLALAFVAAIWLVDIRKRKATRYALTNKRAFVAKAFGGRNMLTFSIQPFFRPLLLEGYTDEVTFGEEDWFHPKTGAKTKRALSFKYLKDGKEVYDIITRVSTAIDAEAEAQK